MKTILVTQQNELQFLIKAKWKIKRKIFSPRKLHFLSNGVNFYPFIDDFDK